MGTNKSGANGNFAAFLDQIQNFDLHITEDLFGTFQNVYAFQVGSGSALRLLECGVHVAPKSLVT